jgi:hypothetical protein
VCPSAEPGTLELLRVQTNAGALYSGGRQSWDWAASGTQAQLEELLILARQRYVSSTLLASIYLGLGEVDTAIEMVERAFEERDPVVLMLNVTPYADSLRGDPRYQDLLRRLRLAA